MNFVMSVSIEVIIKEKGWKIRFNPLYVILEGAVDIFDSFEKFAATELK